VDLGREIFFTNFLFIYFLKQIISLEPKGGGKEEKQQRQWQQQGNQD
jgi:hypothetical protein